MPLGGNWLVKRKRPREAHMVLSIISIIVNVVFFVVLKLNLYTDRAVLGDGTTREWQRSPLDRLYVADKQPLFYLQVFLAAVSIITSILVLVGVKNSIVKIVQIVSTIASVILFVIIMIVAGNIHPKY